jgi:type VII secretion protein EccB
MASRRDQLQSYQFMVQRVLSALVMREPDPAAAPPRRGLGAVFAGAMVAVIIGAGFGVYGLLTHSGSQGWRVDGAVVVEKGTGAPFVYRGGRLYPSANYASARLLGDASRAGVFQVPAASMVGVPRGPLVGIAGAPNDLPDSGKVLSGPWTICASAGTDQVGHSVTTSVLLVGSAQPGGHPVAAGSAVLVRDVVDGATYLLWSGHRYPLDAQPWVLGSLYQGTPSALPVTTAFLDAVPLGATIGPITVPNWGTPSSAVAGDAVGDLLYADTGSGRQYFLVFDDGLARITDLQLVLIEGQQAGAVAQPIDLAAANAAPTSTQLPAPDDTVAPPPRPPALVALGPGDTACVSVSSAVHPASISVGPRLAAGVGVPTTAQARVGAPLADRILVPAGHIAVVQPVAAASASSGSYLLVTDTGTAFPVSGTDDLALLGYGASDAVRIPDTFAARVPLGPVLDPAAAALPLT